MIQYKNLQYKTQSLQNYSKKKCRDKSWMSQTPLSFWNYKKHWTQIWSCGVPQWKLWSKFSKKARNSFRIIVITKRSIFIVNLLSRLRVWLKLGIQVPKNPRHCKGQNWGPAQFKPLPQYSHNSAPSVDYPSWTQLQVLSQAFPHVDIKWLYRGIFYDCASGFCSRISLNRGSVRYILL